MLHHSLAKKNKNQDKYVPVSEEYLFKNHKISKKLSRNMPVEIKSELEDDIYFMRRKFKHNVKKLQRSMQYAHWLEDIAENDKIYERMVLSSRRT